MADFHHRIKLQHYEKDFTNNRHPDGKRDDNEWSKEKCEQRLVVWMRF